MGLLHDTNTGWKACREGRCMVYKLWGGHRKERYMEALVGGEGGRKEVGYIGFWETIDKWST